ncbi:hypothetical protein CMUS01_14666 [Colletotrichum musicola]|uniref:Uncharacterized protein n=1 Tax=Colletotrichum musicola TaxID=2175873 RepID=A0A8H6J2K1_9PEZI|nr:hypothetical protein CMUS01_14666 [Colletotrichum musicola]
MPPQHVEFPQTATDLSSVVQTSPETLEVQTIGTAPLTAQAATTLCGTWHRLITSPKQGGQPGTGYRPPRHFPRRPLASCHMGSSTFDTGQEPPPAPVWNHLINVSNTVNH